MQVWQHSCDVFPFFGNRAITWCSSYLLNVVEAGWNQTLVIQYQCLSDDSKKTKTLKGVFQADGASPLEALLLQHHQVNEYRQPQIILSLRKRICSMKMTHPITSPCHESWHTCSRLHLPSNASWNHRDILSKIPSVLSKLSAWHLLLCILYI